MAANVATLNLAINANTAGLSSGIASAQSQVKGFGQSMSGLGGNLDGLVGKLSGMAAGFLSIRASVEAFGESVARTVELEHMAVRIGTTAASLAKLQYAAKHAGLDTAELQLLMEKMANSVAKGASEGGKAAEVFQKMGLNASELSALPIDEMLQKVGQAISQVDNYAERIRIVKEIFGRGGAAALPLFEGGAESLRAMTAEAERLGTTIDNVTAAKIAGMHSEWLKVEQQMTGITDQIVGAMAPGIEAMLQSMTGMNLQGGAFQLAMEIISGTINELGAELATVGDFIHGVFSAIDGLMLGISGGIIKAVGAIMELIPGMQQLGQQWEAFGNSFLKSADDYIVKGHDLVANAITGGSREDFMAQVAKNKAAAEAAAKKQQENAKHSAGMMIEAGDEMGKRVAEKIEKAAKAPGALEKGSTAAFEASLEARRAADPMTATLAKIQGVNEKQLDQLKDLNKKPLLKVAGI